MRNPINFALCLAAVLACSQTSAAQRKRAGSGPPPSPAATRLQPSPKSSWTILSQVDSENDPPITLVALQPMPVLAPLGMRYTMSFGLNYAYEGSDPAHFKNISLNLFSRSATCSLPEKPDLALTADGHALLIPFQPDVKGADGVWWASSDTEGGATCSESVGVLISPATLTRLAAANALSGKLGAKTFRFSNDNLAAMRDLANRVKLRLTPLGIRR
jgi:hypothetical protein